VCVYHMSDAAAMTTTTLAQNHSSDFQVGHPISGPFRRPSNPQAAQTKFDHLDSIAVRKCQVPCRQKEGRGEAEEQEVKQELNNLHKQK
jgi:hypothetical protein